MSLQGDSPYSRPTYRYTPLLAWLLTPNILLFNAFGKLVFVACDMLCGYLLFEIQRARSIPPSKSADSIFFAWMCNPLVLIISTRGSAESVVILFVLGSLYFLTKQGSLNLCIAGVLHGLSVHTKIYPVTFSLPIYLMLDRHYSGIEGRTLFGFDVLPNKSRVIFVVSAIVSFASATAFCYHWQVCFLSQFFLNTCADPFSDDFECARHHALCIASTTGYLANYEWAKSTVWRIQ